MFAPLVNAHCKSIFLEEKLEAYDGSLRYIYFDKQCGQNTVPDAYFS